jgi:hypothetical protein
MVDDSGGWHDISLVGVGFMEDVMVKYVLVISIIID